MELPRSGPVQRPIARTAARAEDGGDAGGYPRTPAAATPQDDGDVEDRVAPRRIWKTVTAAILLFTIGSVMIYYGVQALAEDKDRAIAMLVIGSISFLPGIWSTWMLLCAWLRIPGYSYDQLPSYDD